MVILPLFGICKMFGSTSVAVVVRLNCLNYIEVFTKSQINRGRVLKNRTDFLVKICCNMEKLTGVDTGVEKKHIIT
jgi:hypothetical protein